MLELLLAAILGLVGGMGRAFRNGRLVKPSKGEDESGNTTYDLGFLGPLGVGVVAGLATGLFHSSPADQSIDFYTLGWALVAGVVGDIVLDYYTNQGYGVSGGQERQETGGVIDEVSATANTTSRELERAHEERRQLQQRVTKLEAENDRLRKSGASGD